MGFPLGREAPCRRAAGGAGGQTSSLSLSTDAENSRQPGLGSGPGPASLAPRPLITPAALFLPFFPFCTSVISLIEATGVGLSLSSLHPLAPFIGSHLFLIFPPSVFDLLAVPSLEKRGAKERIIQQGSSGRFLSILGYRRKMVAQHASIAQLLSQ